MEVLAPPPTGVEFLPALAIPVSNEYQQSCDRDVEQIPGAAGGEAEFAKHGFYSGKVAGEGAGGIKADDLSSAGQCGRVVASQNSCEKPGVEG